MHPRVLILTAATLLVLSGSYKQCISAPPKESLNSLQAHPGFKVELVAAEPLIDAPVAFDWGPDGRLWVVEMRDYPVGMDNKGKPGGRIVFLTDQDGDGKYDQSTVFLDNLLFPNGVMSWGNGILVTCAPDIIYAEDTDGDGRADKRKVLFHGFGEVNPQHRVNGLRWGLDNWVYCANGDFAPERDFASYGKQNAADIGFSATQSDDLRRLAVAGAEIRSSKTGKTFNIRNRDFRVRPDEGLLDPQTGQAQFGRDRDDWGEWFGCNHNTPLWHFALDDYYLRRNPHVNYPASRVVLPTSLIYPLGKSGRATGSGRNEGGNSFTSSCSVMVYRDELFGKEFVENSFTCEPVHNLVHREVLIPENTTFTSRRAGGEERTEFLASSDTMFSPVSIRTAPDGTLWVADMYRQVLEHPHWLAADWEKMIDVRAGAGQGRIYRVYPDKLKPRKWPNLSSLDTAGLVEQLESPNGWLRDKAQQMIVQRGDRSRVDLLERVATEGKTSLGRVHALYILSGLDALKPYIVLRALRDSNSGVRRHTVRLTESRSLRTPELDMALAELVSDPDPSVRLQLGYSLGFSDSSVCAKALAQLLLENAAEPYIVAACTSSLTPKNLATVAAAVNSSTDHAAQRVHLAVLQSALGFHDDAVAANVISTLVVPSRETYTAAQTETLATWLDTLEQSDTSIAKLTERSSPTLRNALQRLDAVFAACRETAINSQASITERVAAARLLGRSADRSKDIAALMELLTPELPDELQLAAVTALGRFADAETLNRLVSAWPGFTPKLRTHLLDVLMKQKDGSNIIVGALRDKIVQPQEIPLVVRQRLSEDSSPDIRARVQALFADRIGADRNKIVTAYAAATQLKGDPRHGLRLFGKTCAACHQLGVVGTAIGPDLTTVRDKPPEWFLPALLDPSRAVEPRFMNYLVVTKDGVSITGVLLEEGSTSLTLVGTNGERHVVLRSNIDEMSCNGKSLMPEGFESQLKVQDVADIIALLKLPSPSPKTVEFNHPSIVRADADGSLRLLPGNCHIFGNEIRIESTQQCLGWWNSRNDKAVWTLDLPRSGRYAVLLNWSCDSSSAKNELELAIDDAKLTWKVEGTGGWESYRETKIGELQLEAGVSTMTAKAHKNIADGTYLFDLKQIRLQPIDVKPSTN